jgi:hypothetical protein
LSNHPRGLLTSVAVGLAVGVAVRRLGRRSGATSEEVRPRLPGDELVPAPMWDSTRAITVSVPPGSVWPWVVQMGYPAYRAGWYTPYWLDRLQWGIRERSADRVRPELQNVMVGDRIPDSPDFSVFSPWRGSSTPRRCSAGSAPVPSSLSAGLARRARPPWAHVRALDSPVCLAAT